MPVDSPIAQSGLLFYNTLFDENAACHFAFGQAYPACVPGGDDLREDELVRRGINVVSTTHVDFMVGTEDLSIIGTTKDGREVAVFENGRFALYKTEKQTRGNDKVKSEFEFYQRVERSILTTYRKELWKPFILAVKRYELIQEGDNIAVCISGGKDSMLLAKLHAGIAAP